MSKYKIRVGIEDFVLCFAVFSVVTIVANWVWLTGDKAMAEYVPEYPTLPFTFSNTQPTKLSAEVYNVAEAIHSGRGFSDPFRDKTGPTGWTPPMLSSLMAVGLYITDGSREKLAIVFMVFQVIALAIVGTLCLHIGRLTRSAGLMVVAMVIVFCTNFGLSLIHI